MEITLSPAMLASIDEHLSRMRGNHDILDVYKTAELIRRQHIGENVAREDIIEKLVARAGSNVPLEFNRLQYASDEITEIIDGTDMEFLMPLNNPTFTQ